MKHYTDNVVDCWPMKLQDSEGKNVINFSRLFNTAFSRVSNACKYIIFEIRVCSKPKRSDVEIFSNRVAMSLIGVVVTRQRIYIYIYKCKHVIALYTYSSGLRASG